MKPNSIDVPLRDRPINTTKNKLEVWGGKMCLYRTMLFPSRILFKYAFNMFMYDVGIIPKENEISSRLLTDENGEYVLLKTDGGIPIYWTKKYYVNHKDFLDAYNKIK